MDDGGILPFFEGLAMNLPFAAGVCFFA